MRSVQKKVIVRTVGGFAARGYLPQSGILFGDEVPLLDVSGRVSSILLIEIQAIYYVRDFNIDDGIDPQRMLRTTFAGRPRGDGLWIRLTFHGGEVLEGLANFQTDLADALIGDRGVYLTPPDSRGNTQRVFVPRSALNALEVAGFVTAPSKRAAKAIEREVEVGQTSLFGEDSDADDE